MDYQEGYVFSFAYCSAIANWNYHPLSRILLAIFTWIDISTAKYITIISMKFCWNTTSLLCSYLKEKWKVTISMYATPYSWSLKVSPPLKPKKWSMKKHVQPANVRMSKSYEREESVSLYHHVGQKETRIHIVLFALFCVGHHINPCFSLCGLGGTEAIALFP